MRTSGQTSWPALFCPGALTTASLYKTHFWPPGAHRRAGQVKTEVSSLGAVRLGCGGGRLAVRRCRRTYLMSRSARETCAGSRHVDDVLEQITILWNALQIAVPLEEEQGCLHIIVGMCGRPTWFICVWAGDSHGRRNYVFQVVCSTFVKRGGTEIWHQHTLMCHKRLVVALVSAAGLTLHVKHPRFSLSLKFLCSSIQTCFVVHHKLFVLLIMTFGWLPLHHAVKHAISNYIYNASQDGHGYKLQVYESTEAYGPGAVLSL